MSSERSISPDPLPRSQSHAAVNLNDDKDSNGRVVRQSSSTAQKRRRDSPKYKINILFFDILIKYYFKT